MLDLFWNLLSLVGLCLAIVIIFGGSGVDIPEEAEAQDE